MKQHRFFIDPSFIKQEIVTLPKELSQQAVKVLRLRKGDHFIVLDNLENEYEVELIVPDSKEVTSKILSTTKNNNEPKTKITLYQSLLPREKFELALQKGVEVGVSKFIPLKTAYTVYGKDYVNEQKLERWSAVIREAAEQSERGKLPLIIKALDFKDAIQESVKKGITFIAWEYEGGNSLTEQLKKCSNNKDDTQISIFIGPEGGFTKEEIEYAINNGAKTISLGPRILRSETAGPVLVSLLLFQLGELDSFAHLK